MHFKLGENVKLICLRVPYLRLVKIKNFLYVITDPIEFYFSKYSLKDKSDDRRLCIFYLGIRWGLSDFRNVKTSVSMSLELNFLSLIFPSCLHRSLMKLP